MLAATNRVGPAWPHTQLQHPRGGSCPAVSGRARRRMRAVAAAGQPGGDAGTPAYNGPAFTFGPAHRAYLAEEAANGSASIEAFWAWMAEEHEQIRQFWANRRARETLRQEAGRKQLFVPNAPQPPAPASPPSTAPAHLPALPVKWPPLAAGTAPAAARAAAAETAAAAAVLYSSVAAGHEAAAEAAQAAAASQPAVALVPAAEGYVRAAAAWQMAWLALEGARQAHPAAPAVAEADAAVEAAARFKHLRRALRE